MLRAGDQAPTFALQSTAGDAADLEARRSNGPVVVLTNRGTWCSYCAEQLQTFSALSYDLWRHQGVDVLPIFPDPVPDLVELRDRFGLAIQLLSDPDLEVVRAYADVEEHARFGEIPVASTTVVDADGVVRYTQVAEHAADRTYANYVRSLIGNDFEPPFAEE